MLVGPDDPLECLNRTRCRSVPVGAGRKRSARLCDALAVSAGTTAGEQLTATAAAVTALLLKRDFEFDCVLGSRLLVDVLQDDGVDATAIGTHLLVVDPVAGATSCQRGAVLQIGGVQEARSEGFNGHVVVRATQGGDTYLLDSTIGQLSDHSATAALAVKLLVLVTRLQRPWPTAARTDITLPIDGWTVSYRHRPELAWTGVRGWNHPALPELIAEVKSLRDTGVDLLELMRRRVASRSRSAGRNDPCPCGSRKKYKRCCGR